MYTSSHPSSAKVKSSKVKFTAKYTSKLSFILHLPSIRAAIRTVKNILMQYKYTKTTLPSSFSLLWPITIVRRTNISTRQIKALLHRNVLFTATTLRSQTVQVDWMLAPVNMSLLIHSRMKGRNGIKLYVQSPMTIITCGVVLFVQSRIITMLRNKTCQLPNEWL